MGKKLKLNVITLSLLGVSQFSYADLVLDEIQVTSDSINSEKKIFTEAKAKSVRSNIFQSSENVDNVVRSMPGAFTQQDKASGVLSLNIRGESGLGRANSLVDGVTQTFYATDFDSGRGGSNSQFGALVDPNFITDVDLTKGSFSGSSGVNTLFGSANFKTLGVNDVIKGENNFGFLAKGLTGDNETKSNYMLMGAGRKWLDNGGYLGALYGYSHREVAQNYKVGGNGRRIGNFGEDYLNRKKQEYFESNLLKFDSQQNRWVRDFSQKNAEGKSYWDYSFNQKYNDPAILQRDYVDDLEESWQENQVPQWDLTPIDPDNLKQRSESHLAKIEYLDDKNQLTLQLRTLDNHIAKRKIEGRNYQLNYGYNLNPYLNLNLLAAHNSSKQKYPKGSHFTGWALLDYLETKNTSDTLDINNIIELKLPKEVDLKTTIGFNFFKNQYSKNRFPEELSLFYDGPSQDQGLYDFKGRFKGDKGILPQKATILQPSGKQNFTTVYLDTSLTKDIYQLDYNVNLVKYHFNGEYTGYFNTEEEFKSAFGENSDIYKAHCDPNCDLYEPVFNKSGKKQAVNHSVNFAINLNDYFMPFIGFSRTHRMPNVQEMYFSQLGDSGVNTTLKPESSNTYQLGFNTFKEGILKDTDILGLKVVGYRSDIKNYIHNVYGKWWNTQASNIPSWVTSTGLEYTIQHRNYQDKVKKSGLELEMNYDFGRFFTKLSYAYQKTNQPTNYSDASESPRNSSKEDQIKQGYGLSKISMLPRDYGRLEIGTRWFDNKLVIGSSVRYYGKSKRASVEERYIDGTSNANSYERKDKGKRIIKETEIIKKQPMIVDFYIAYQPIKDLVIRADLQNAFNKRYIDPLDANNDSATQRYFNLFDQKGGFDDEEVDCEEGICNGKYGGHSHSVLNNYARGRTFVLSAHYRF